MRLTVPAILCLLLVTSAAAERPWVPQPHYGEPNGTFPSWEERVVAQLTNRARSEPATELAGCPAGQCLEAACYTARAPLFWDYDLNQAARFHSLTMGMFPF